MSGVPRKRRKIRALTSVAKGQGGGRRPPPALSPRRRRGNVYAAGVVDAGAGIARCHHGDLCKPLLRDPQYRTCAHRSRRRRTHGPFRCSTCTIPNLIGSSSLPVWASRRGAQRRLKNSAAVRKRYEKSRSTFDRGGRHLNSHAQLGDQEACARVSSQLTSKPSSGGRCGRPKRLMFRSFMYGRFWREADIRRSARSFILFAAAGGQSCRLESYRPSASIRRD
jgi:hypothetical protein